MNLLPFFTWCESTMLGETVRASLWLFPVIESLHLVAFAVLGGTVLLIDLRLLRFLFRSQPVVRLLEEARPWFLGSLAAMVVTGVLLFLSEAIKCYYSGPFWWKIRFLLAAVVFAATVRRRVLRMDETRLGPLWGRLVGLVSIELWGGVAWGGRWIGFSG